MMRINSAPKLFKILSSVLLCMLSCAAFAEQAVTVDDVVTNLFGPTIALGRMMHALFFCAGVGFVVGAMIQYKAHRDNPSQVRISTPILLLILGLVLLIVPLLSMQGTASFFLKTYA